MIASLLQKPVSLWQLGGLVIAAIGFLIFLFVFLRYANLYVRSVLTGAGVGLLDMVGMSLRRVNPARIVDARVKLVQARLPEDRKSTRLNSSHSQISYA